MGGVEQEACSREFSDNRRHAFPRLLTLSREIKSERFPDLIGILIGHVWGTWECEPSCLWPSPEKTQTDVVCLTAAGLPASNVPQVLLINIQDVCCPLELRWGSGGGA